MKIWFDADNGPHVLIFRPLIAELSARGHNVVVTARDRTNTCELLDLYGIPYRTVGGLYRAGLIGKIQGTLQRAAALAAAMRRDKPDVSFGHGSRSLPIASRMLGVPSVTMYDYEWVNATIFNLTCNKIMLPDAISRSRCEEAGINVDKVFLYDGFKEELYLGASDLDQTVAGDLGLSPDKVKVLLRPSATTAHYHNPESDVILDEVLRQLADRDDVQLVFLPRTDDQREQPARAGVKHVIIPDRVYDGPSLVATMDLVLSGGGTMTREAAIMGVPSYSFFRGDRGMVDETLEADGRLLLFSSPADVADKLRLERRSGQAQIPDATKLVASLCDQIVAVGR